MTEAKEYRPIPDLAPGEPGWIRPELPEDWNDPVAFKKRLEEIEAELPSVAERRERVRKENPPPSFDVLHRPLK